MGSTFIESTNLETAQQLAMLILERSSIEEMTAKFISDTNAIRTLLNDAFK